MAVSEPLISIRPTRAVSRASRLGPIVSLLLLAPIISEVLYGATRLSVIFVLIPEILTWGCAALLIRECVRRWNKGWPSMLLLGVALAFAEEWIIQQTSIAPLVGLAQHAYGRVWGVNWVYFLWAVGYESVWVVMVPVKLTELLFPARRQQPWLGTRGFVIASATFLVGAYLAWYGWTQRARVRIFHMPPYSPPRAYLLGALGVIALLVFAAYKTPPLSKREATAPPPWIVGLAMVVLGSSWSAYVLLGFGSFPAIAPRLALGGALLGCMLTLGLVLGWTSASDWGDQHRYALVLAGVISCCLGGVLVFKVAGALRIDWIGKTIFNTAAILWLIALGPRLAGRSS